MKTWLGGFGYFLFYFIFSLHLPLWFKAGHARMRQMCPRDTGFGLACLGDDVMLIRSVLFPEAPRAKMVNQPRRLKGVGLFINCSYGARSWYQPGEYLHDFALSIRMESICGAFLGQTVWSLFALFEQSPGRR
ncbi:hypothetical protein P175DRAFT_0163418 [Aspergillus ochraceoroseus IBT 24754]|uniref:Uncharacterized protein n=1 Tax=Aspergillus ochraceoroseus IBT 24754 TaxID=1392256 RepID=A0A2T5M3S8_9EURO|nr:uncharacterized protein P175DRAFT_0163418 [Aspergillus ochraceoroseus IBT 24754]PTU23195.1 hypothetical protein P175DRAFT_0163418 [Aspergillus ochraceoroseus IBT 24754]